MFKVNREENQENSPKSLKMIAEFVVRKAIKQQIVGKMKRIKTNVPLHGRAPVH